MKLLTRRDEDAFNEYCKWLEKMAGLSIESLRTELDCEIETLRLDNYMLMCNKVNTLFRIIEARKIAETEAETKLREYCLEQALKYQQKRKTNKGIVQTASEIYNWLAPSKIR